MTKLDQFESTFRAAAKEVFAFEPPALTRISVVTDMNAENTAALTAEIRDFLRVLDRGDPAWTTIPGDGFDSVAALLEAVETARPDLIVTYRHLHSDAWRWPFSLGEYLDVLAQATTTPVLVLPHPDADRALPHSVADTNRVMAVTDHLSGDHELVNHALALTAEGGTCWLTHVEGGAQFERYMETLSKIPEIDTETARKTIAAQLLKEPREYIHSCRESVTSADLSVTIEEIVVMGRRLDEYAHLIDQHEIDLLVFHTKDEDQLAMHGLAYPLAVELRQIPLLML